jgi:hypothetical protein
MPMKLSEVMFMSNNKVMFYGIEETISYREVASVIVLVQTLLNNNVVSGMTEELAHLIAKRVSMSGKPCRAYPDVSPAYLEVNKNNWSVKVIEF